MTLGRSSASFLLLTLILVLLVGPAQAGTIFGNNACTSTGIPAAGIVCDVMDTAAPSQIWPRPPLTTSIGLLTSSETISIRYITGTVNLNQSVWPEDFFFNPDGSLVNPAATTDWSTATYEYNYMKPGSPYSKAFGGDGINHFAGGGANYDAYSSSPDTGWGYYFGTAFPQTTDTSDPNAVRFGSLVGTLDTGLSWFYIGYGRTIGAGTNIPIPDGATLNLAVYDADYGDQNAGFYRVMVADVPEPTAILLVASGLLGLALLRRRASD